MLSSASCPSNPRVLSPVDLPHRKMGPSRSRGFPPSTEFKPACDTAENTEMRDVCYTANALLQTVRNRNKFQPWVDICVDLYVFEQRAMQYCFQSNSKRL